MPRTHSVPWTPEIWGKALQLFEEGRPVRKILITLNEDFPGFHISRSQLAEDLSRYHQDHEYKPLSLRRPHSENSSSSNQQQSAISATSSATLPVVSAFPADPPSLKRARLERFERDDPPWSPLPVLTKPLSRGPQVITVAQSAEPAVSTSPPSSSTRNISKPRSSRDSDFTKTKELLRCVDEMWELVSRTRTSTGYTENQIMELFLDDRRALPLIEGNQSWAAPLTTMPTASVSAPEFPQSNTSVRGVRPANSVTSARTRRHITAVHFDPDGRDAEMYPDVTQFIDWCRQRPCVQRDLHARIPSTSSIPCPRCQTQFNDKAAFRKHVMRFDPAVAWRCETEGCGKMFVRKDALQAHVKDHGYGSSRSNYSGSLTWLDEAPSTRFELGRRAKCPHPECFGLSHLWDLDELYDSHYPSHFQTQQAASSPEPTAPLEVVRLDDQTEDEYIPSFSEIEDAT